MSSRTRSNLRGEGGCWGAVAAPHRLPQSWRMEEEVRTGRRPPDLSAKKTRHVASIKHAFNQDMLLFKCAHSASSRPRDFRHEREQGRPYCACEIVCATGPVLGSCETWELPLNTESFIFQTVMAFLELFQ